jgi:hypothetical protein
MRAAIPIAVNAPILEPDFHFQGAIFRKRHFALPAQPSYTAFHQMILFWSLVIH